MKPALDLHIVFSLATLSILGACSSGSGGGSGVPTAPIGITEDNAAEVAAGMPMTSSLIEFQEFMGFENLTAQGTGTFDCPDGGSITAAFEVDAAPVGEVSSGDRFSVIFNDCMMDPSSTIDGGIAIDFDTITGDWLVDDVWEVDLGFEVNGLTFSSGPTTGFFDGQWSQNASQDSEDSAFSLAGDFTAAVDDGAGLEASVLNGLVLTWAYDALAAEATYSVDGRFASTVLGGSVTVTTLTPFVIRDGDPNAYAGSMRATGALGSSLTFTVLDETFVQLDVDADGDGIDEFTITLSWVELEE
jgi:hypothetical protein